MAKDFFKTNTWKTGFWIIVNAIIGLAPLLIMMGLLEIVSSQTQDHFADEIKKLLNGGILLFVPCTLMGASVVDILNEEVAIKGFKYFALTITPFLVLFFLLVVYVLIVSKNVDEAFFRSRKTVTYIIAMFAILYCSLAKYYLYKEQDLKNKKPMKSDE